MPPAMGAERPYATLLLALLLAAVSPGGAAEKSGPGGDEAEEAGANGVEEEVTVSASATSDDPLDAPAAVDVLTGDDLEQRPADTVVDQLRRVPGINVIQFSARDIELASRASTGQANNSTLALVDGRTLYQDFLGFVMWEFAPTDPSLIDRIEIVRGPASSLWGANAVGGLVHVITKSPQETLGTTVEIGGGAYGTRSVHVTHSVAARGWAVRVGAGLFESDPFPRPQTITNMFGETIDPDLGVNEAGAHDAGTRQPRFDFRADRTDGLRGVWSFQGGWARTRGRLATGLGPFDIDPSTSMSYLQGRYRSGAYEAQVYLNYTDGDATNLINGVPLSFKAAATNLSLRSRRVIGSRLVLGYGAEARLSSYALSIAPRGRRRAQAALFGEAEWSLTPHWSLAGGLRVDHVVETIGTIASPRIGLMFRPGENQTLRVAWGRAFRSPSVIESDLWVPSIPVAILDWNEIDREVVGFPFFALVAEWVCSQRPDNCGAPPGEIPTYTAVTAARGSRELDAERTSSVELGYAARLGRLRLSATVYRTRSSNGIDFPVLAYYGNGPDGVPGTADDIVLPPDPDGDGTLEAPPLDVCPGVSQLHPFDEMCAAGPVGYNHFLSVLLDGQIPALFGYRNRGRSENRGFELGLDWSTRSGLSLFASYSWQDDARADGVPMPERIAQVLAEREAGADLDGDGRIADTTPFINNPPAHRLSAGVTLDRGRWFGGVTADYVSRAFWQDVMTADFWGWTSGYTVLGIQGGWRHPGGHLELVWQVTNLLDRKVQQHIFGDVIGRRASARIRWRLGPAR
ncbi:MAG: TonB-dependent receptor [Acidobacteria bacterium]|nr:MAG: TonB-dependent receptor [Acidobacteriota bacterium]